MHSVNLTRYCQYHSGVGGNQERVGFRSSVLLAWFWLATHGKLMVYYSASSARRLVTHMLCAYGEELVFLREWIVWMATINHSPQVAKLVLENWCLLLLCILALNSDALVLIGMP